MSKTQLDVNTANGIAIDVANDIVTYFQFGEWKYTFSF